MKIRIEVDIEWDEFIDSDELARHVVKAIQPDMGQYWNVVRAGTELEGSPVAVELIKSEHVR